MQRLFLPIEATEREKDWDKFEKNPHIRSLSPRQRFKINEDMGSGRFLKEAVYTHAPRVYPYVFKDNLSRNLDFGKEYNDEFFNERIAGTAAFAELPEDKQRQLRRVFKYDGHRNPEALVTEYAPGLAKHVDFMRDEQGTALHSFRATDRKQMTAAIRKQARGEELDSLSSGWKRAGWTVLDHAQEFAAYGVASFVDTALFGAPSVAVNWIESAYDMEIYPVPITWGGKVGQFGGMMAGFAVGPEAALLKMSAAKGAKLLAQFAPKLAARSPEVARVLGQAVGTAGTFAGQTFMISVLGDKPLKEAVGSAVERGAYAFAFGAILPPAKNYIAKAGHSRMAQKIGSLFHSKEYRKLMNMKLNFQANSGGKAPTEAELVEIINKHPDLQTFIAKKPWTLMNIAKDEEEAVGLLGYYFRTAREGFKGHKLKSIVEAGIKGEKWAMRMQLKLQRKYLSMINKTLRPHEVEQFGRIERYMHQHKSDIDKYIQKIGDKYSIMPDSQLPKKMRLERFFKDMEEPARQRIYAALVKQRQFYKAFHKVSNIHELQMARAFGFEPKLTEYREGFMPTPHTGMRIVVDLGADVDGYTVGSTFRSRAEAAKFVETKRGTRQLMAYVLKARRKDEWMINKNDALPPEHKEIAIRRLKEGWDKLLRDVNAGALKLHYVHPHEALPKVARTKAGVTLQAVVPKGSKAYGTEVKQKDYNIKTMHEDPGTALKQLSLETPAGRKGVFRLFRTKFASDRARAAKIQNPITRKAKLESLKEEWARFKIAAQSHESTGGGELPRYMEVNPDTKQIRLHREWVDAKDVDPAIIKMYKQNGWIKPPLPVDANPEMVPSLRFDILSDKGLRPSFGRYVPGYMHYDPVELMYQYSRTASKNLAYKEFKYLYDKLKTEHWEELNESTKLNVEKYAMRVLGKKGPYEQNIDEFMYKMLDNKFLGNMPIIKSIVKSGFPSRVTLGSLRNATSVAKLGFFNIGSPIANYMTGIGNLYAYGGARNAWRGFAAVVKPTRMDKVLWDRLGITEYLGHIKADQYEPGKWTKSLTYFFNKS